MAERHRKDTAPALRNVYLTGFMCAGKTLAGLALARALGRRFSDTDLLVKKATGRSAVGYIRTKGLAAFRRAEAAAVKGLTRERGGVAALGGGYYPSGRRAPLLRATGVTVFLYCPWPELERRLRKARASRPLLAGPWAKASARARKLYAARLPYYRRADITVNTSGLTPESAAARIAALLKERALI